MNLTVIGVRHHSPACARLVGTTIAALQPAFVLIEGPADMNARIGELLLGHDLPVAVFTSYLDEQRRHGSWAPFCEYSPEWEALRAGHASGAELRFIDLPAWHEAFADRDNRYADAELRYAEAVDRLCTEFGVDNSDALWDHVVEMAPADGLADRLAAYFELIRGDTAAGPSDTAREAYMAAWLRAACAEAGDRPVVAVVGGFHRPALLRLATTPADPPIPTSAPAPIPAPTPTQTPAFSAVAPAAASSSPPASESPGAVAGFSPLTSRSSGAGSAAGGAGWPEIPAPPDGATAGSYLVPYSFRRLDAFGGYQSGMPSPEYYQRLWESGPEEAARYLVTAVAGRLRKRGQPVSTADLIAARAGAEALALLRGHDHPARVDVLDGLASALVSEALEVPLPWAVRGTVSAGQHPAVVEMTAALSGERVGRLHPDTPLPPLVHAATAELERYRLDEPGEHTADLTEAHGRTVSRVLHRLRVLGVPGFRRDAGPATGIDPVLRERWTTTAHEHRLAALIEAGGYGPTLEAATAALITQRIAGSSGDLARLADALFDAALSGVTDLGTDVPALLERGVAAGSDLAELGRVLAITLALWRHDRLLGTAGSDTLGTVIAAATRRILWLSEGWHAAGAPADRTRIAAVVAVRDAVLHAGAVGVDRTAAVESAGRIAADRAAPPDLRGAFYGLGRTLLAATAPPAGLAPAVPAGLEPVSLEPAGLVIPADSVAADDPPVAPGGSPPGPGRGGGSSGSGGSGEPFPAPDHAVRGAFAAGTAGDWLAGLFGVAREPVLAPDGILDLLDDLISGFAAEDFLVALPALRQAFEYFPPRERATIGDRLLARRGLAGSGRDLLRATGDPRLVAAGMALDETIEQRLVRAGLISLRETA
ncbi:DUF5682 family protein [Actinoplanes derwentensis]|uniref:Uncharacterized protein n=1 Tax=Actinoplanes derwentensis TaxID=113562 RepID=A0A1H2DAH7_9ACTN|nr:DUF5682 family protein [Actinoplanes derwentensis]GID81750.1 hypothetical protein Ade03nite_06740 [Actinoplanes derwentensis]SDT79758.1 hypothetical protein SAMN04489716_8919 [Actinoplanes derwentensis]